MDRNKRGPTTSALERLPADMQRKYYRNYRPWVAEVETISITGLIWPDTPCCSW